MAAREPARAPRRGSAAWRRRGGPASEPHCAARSRAALRQPPGRRLQCVAMATALGGALLRGVAAPRQQAGCGRAVAPSLQPRPAAARAAAQLRGAACGGSRALTAAEPLALATRAAKPAGRAVRRAAATRAAAASASVSAAAAAPVRAPRGGAAHCVRTPARAWRATRASSCGPQLASAAARRAAGAA